MKKRITAAMLAVMLLVLPLGTGLVVHKSHRMILERERTRALSEEAAISRSIYKEIGSGDYRQLLKTAQSMQRRYGSDVLFLTLFYQGTAIGQKVQFEDMKLLLETKGRCTLLDAKQELFYIAHQLRDGLILLTASDVSAIYELHHQLTIWAVLLCTVCMIAGVLLSLFFSGILLKPIRAAAQAASALRQGDYSADLSKSHIKEVDDFIQTFDAMKKAVREREEALKEQADQTQQLLEALSHEMRTPLTALMAGTEMLQSAKLSKKQEYILLNTMAKEAKRLTTMDERLLLLTHLTHKTMEMETFSLEKMAEEATSVFQNIRIENNQVLDQNVQLTGERELLIELMRNLIVNAERSGTEKPVLVILHPNGFSVKDDGCGMTEQQRKHMFEPFYKADKARTRKAGGAGLGLSICMKIVQLHHARLTVKSKQGIGTIVTYQQ